MFPRRASLALPLLEGRWGIKVPTPCTENLFPSLTQELKEGTESSLLTQKSARMEATAFMARKRDSP